MKLRSLKEAEAALRRYVPASGRLTPRDTMLDRIVPLMKLLGNPQDRLKIVHIAGTSGKTSTAYYMAALLAATDCRTGLTISPHVDRITERLQLNGQPIDDEVFCRELGALLDIVQGAGLQPSYFELVYAFTLWEMDRQHVEYAVVETGLGGLHDATNVAGRPDKICVITDIGFDHMHILGNTLPEIAAQKIGIVHTHNHVFMYEQAEAIMTVIQQWTAQHRAPLHLVPAAQQTSDFVETLPAYQRRNWQLARAVYDYLAERDNLSHLTRQALQQTQLLQVPARMEVRRVGGKTLVMDGAHNEQKMAAFLDSFRGLYPGVRPAVLVALKDEKDYHKVVQLLSPLAARVMTTAFQTTQDLPVKSMDPEQLARAFRAAGAEDVTCLPDYHQALRALLSAPETVGVITGSFYLLGQMRNNQLL